MSKDKIPLGFLGHVVEFWPILDDAKKLGIPISEKGINKLLFELKEITKEIKIEIQLLIPNELKNLKPRRKLPNGEIEFGYKKISKPIRELILERWQNYIDLQSEWNARNEEKIYALNFKEFLEQRPIIKIDKKGKETRLVLVFDETDNKTIWYLREDFKPSSKQLIKYIKWKGVKNAISLDKEERKLARFYKIPQTIDIKTKQLRDTTGKKALEDLLNKTGDEILRLVIGDKDYEGTLGERAGLRSIEKVISNDIPRWMPARDGSVHTTWGIKAASGQLDARSPNILNASKHTVIGKLFRKEIECPEDEIFVECDKKSYHVATMGYCANDPTYIRFSQLDPHSYFTAYVANGVLGLPKLSMSDSEILTICKGYKNHPQWGWVRQNISKVIVLGNQLGLGAKKIYINNNNASTDPITRQRVKPFKSIEQIKGLQSMLAKMFSLPEIFKKVVRREAHQNKILTNEWGYCQKFWEVFIWKYNKEENNWYEQPGSESEKALAFKVQSIAFGDIRDKLLQLRNMDLLNKYPFISSIHDSFVFRIKKNLLENFIQEVYPVLIAPSRMLIKSCCPKGLEVGVELHWGRNFGEYHMYKNPEGMREHKF